MKVNSTVYKGIEFIEISTLPNEQRTSLLQTINPELLIKILVDGKLMPRCIQYKYYEEWYENSYQSSLIDKKESNAIAESRDAELKPNFQI
ncbi:hypothetical protein [Chryseolinea sp. H1M3-3]|jgi:hypothetical protein|uniref:hypothetical protein n=1 Tax=Chryseolinea sp. H1M3-3 TaxID=3034144 RepID=UPI0023EB9FDC|nr:hypothetical protein [Chryseolinea sp. H1M3-3]